MKSEKKCNGVHKFAEQGQNKIAMHQTKKKITNTSDAFIMHPDAQKFFLGR